MRNDHLAAELPPPHPDYSVIVACYVKNAYVVRCRSNGTGYMTHAMYVLRDDLSCRYVHRSHGYIVSPAKLRKFVRLYAEWKDAQRFLTGSD